MSLRAYVCNLTGSTTSLNFMSPQPFFFLLACVPDADAGGRTVFTRELPVLSERHTPERRFPVPHDVDAAPSWHTGPWPPPAPSLLRNVRSLKINFKQRVWTSLPRTVLRSKAASASEDALEEGLSDTSLSFPAHPGAFCDALGKRRPPGSIRC